MFRFSNFLRDLTTIRKALILSAVLFAGGIAIGWGSEEFEQLLISQLQGLGEMSQELRMSDNPEWSFFVFIFLNNSIKSVLVMLSGILLGVIPFIFLLVNGMVIGFLLKIVQASGESLFDLIVKGLLPHGIIEIPVIVIACGYGLAFGGLVFRSMLASGEKRRGIGTEWRGFWRKLGTASLWVVVLLLVAAIIESTITLWLMS
ncbi:MULTISPECIES: stage II sporulation protein M [Paenibacillus]|uniref:stage II sporulation protein M n=1 Tax=Paenibacillus TaxID=44249 RepID=UPI00048FFFA7|nr:MULTISPECIES: stage II sporulation protein M [Paenibacillus]MCM3497232.1 stage II sporulation protein M [Paenibacillus lactis]